jgi:hypothetical protein
MAGTFPSKDAAGDGRAAIFASAHERNLRDCGAPAIKSGEAVANVPTALPGAGRLA